MILQISLQEMHQKKQAETLQILNTSTSIEVDSSSDSEAGG